MGEDRLDLGAVPRPELDDGSRCECGEHGGARLGSPLLAAAVLHETEWVFCWASRAVSEVIWGCCRLAWEGGLGCQLQPRCSELGAPRLHMPLYMNNG